MAMLRRSFLAATAAFPLAKIDPTFSEPKTKPKEIGRLEISRLRLGSDFVGDLEVVCYADGYYKITRNGLAMLSRLDQEWDYGSFRIRVQIEDGNANVRIPMNRSEAIGFIHAQVISVDGELVAEIG